METKIQEVKFRDYAKEIISLREKVWNHREKYVAEKYFKHKFFDQYEEEAFHWIIVNNDLLIASCRLSIHNNHENIPDVRYIEKPFLKTILLPIGSINRLVIDPQWHGHGLGKLLDQVRFDKCKLLNCRSIIGITHSKRCQQMLNYGFTRLAFLKEFEGITSVTGDEMPSLFYKIL